MHLWNTYLHIMDTSISQTSFFCRWASFAHPRLAFGLHLGGSARAVHPGLPTVAGDLAESLALCFRPLLGDLVGFYGDLVGFYGDFMGYEWDIPSGDVKIAKWKIDICS